MLTSCLYWQLGIGIWIAICHLALHRRASPPRRNRQDRQGSLQMPCILKLSKGYYPVLTSRIEHPVSSIMTRVPNSEFQITFILKIIN